MSTNNDFINQLKNEAYKWIKDGVITEDQKNKILSRYKPAPQPPTPVMIEKKENSGINLPKIIFILAGILVLTGIILFYAANWKKMSATVKMIQVFLLIIITYSIAFYFLLIKKKRIVLGKIALSAGIVSFGIGIILTAQTFHISAHPTNGILIWATGGLLISALMSDKAGMYISTFLFFLWNTWEISLFNNPNYIFIAVIILLGFLFYRLKETAGFLIAFLLFFMWFYQVNVHWLSYNSRFESIALFTLLHLPLGILLINTTKFLNDKHFFKIPAYFFRIAGWISLTVPFFVLSWPFETKKEFFIFKSGTLRFSFEYLTLLLPALITSTYLFFKHKKENAFIFGATVLSAVLFLLPLGNKTMLMVSMHLSIVLFIAGLLYFQTDTKNFTFFNKIFAFILVILFLVVKSIGLSILGGLDYHYFAAYLNGAVIFALVVFLINRFIYYFHKKSGVRYSYKVVDSAAAITGFILLYILSFKIYNQQSIFDADTVVIILISMFVVISAFLYGYLFTFSKEKLPLILSALIFTISVTVLIISRRSIGWITYSAIFNIILFIYTSTLIYYSTKINSLLLLNFAIAGFGLHVVTRYFDLMWDLLSGSAIFIVTGILGILTGLLIEWNRRRLSKRIHSSKERNNV